MRLVLLVAATLLSVTCARDSGTLSVQREAYAPAAAPVATDITVPEAADPVPVPAPVVVTSLPPVPPPSATPKPVVVETPKPAPPKPIVIEAPKPAPKKEPVREPVQVAQAPPKKESPPMPPFAAYALSQGQAAILAAHGWDARVGEKAAVWVSVSTQTFRIVQGGRVTWEVACATAERGTGSIEGSLQTPLGWHVVEEKRGDGAAWGQVFRSGGKTNTIWKPGDDVKEDLVLTRILFLGGLEPGKNKGGNVDSRARYIYVHGTNDEARIGTPSSHGCVRLRNDDVITAYGLIPTGTLLLITEDPE